MIRKKGFVSRRMSNENGLVLPSVLHVHVVLTLLSNYSVFFNLRYRRFFLLFSTCELSHFSACPTQ